MGTNYYLHRNICPHCGRADEELHIGKSSAGWCFSLHVTDEITSLDDWKKLFAEEGAVIKDEYGDIETVETMLRTITQRRGREGPSAFGQNSDEWFRQNHATPGPFGLARQRIDHQHCVGHGVETYDLITGDFS